LSQLPSTLQRGSLKAAAAALAAPTEAECGLPVDTDVAEEQQRQRQRCASYLRKRSGGAAGGGGLPAEAVLLPAQAAVLLPAQAAVVLPAKGGGAPAGSLKAAVAGGGGCGDAEQELLPASGGDELALTGQPYVVEMFGLRKVYKVSVVMWVCGSGSRRRQICVLPVPCLLLTSPISAYQTFAQCS
jgi:hypothetical protein